MHPPRSPCRGDLCSSYPDEIKTTYLSHAVSQESRLVHAKEPVPAGGNGCFRLRFGQFPPFSSLACRKLYATVKKGKCLPLTPAIPLPCAILYNILSNIRVYWA